MSDADAAAARIAANLAARRTHREKYPPDVNTGAQPVVAVTELLAAIKAPFTEDDLQALLDERAEQRAAASLARHADLAGLLERARALQSDPPDKARLGRAQREAVLTQDDVRWVYLAADLVEAIVTELEPGTLRSPAELPDEPPLFTTRRLVAALEKRLACVEEALGLNGPGQEHGQVSGPFTLPVQPLDLSDIPLANLPGFTPPRSLHEPLRTRRAETRAGDADA